MANKSLHKARRNKNDEFYTQMSDIEKEVKHYRDQFKGKVVYCNCDYPNKSNFWKYFYLKFESLGLKKLIATHYDLEKPTYKLEYDGKEVVKTDLLENGDFRSNESIELLKEADIVCTNPPFSLYREYVAQLIEYEKNFLIIGNFNSVTYKEIFPLIKEEKMWLGYTAPKEFIQPDGNIKKFGNINWFTNLDVTKRHEDIILYKEYSTEEYPEYDNYHAINIDKVVEIPRDYKGVMGVPITFLTKYNPEQFEILGIMNTGEVNKGIRLPDTPHGRPIINGKEKYLRILIRNKRLNKKEGQ